MSTLTDVVIDTAIYEKSFESMENMMDEPSAPPLPSYESQKYHFFSRFLSCFYHHHHHYHHHHK